MPFYVCFLRLFVYFAIFSIRIQQFSCDVWCHQCDNLTTLHVKIKDRGFYIAMPRQMTSTASHSSRTTYKSEELVVERL